MASAAKTKEAMFEDGNKIINCPDTTLLNVEFQGKNNVLFFESDDIKLQNCTIKFNGDGSLVYLSKSNRKYAFSITTYNNSTVYIGKNNYMNGVFKIIASEQKNVIIGNGCLISYGCSIKTADAHLVYDITTGKRLNHSKSVFIGDHAWLGQDVMVLKGTRIGSGAIVGARSLVAGKSLSSNTSYGGNPVKRIRSNVFFPYGSVHKYTTEQVKDSDSYIKKNAAYIFEQDGLQLAYEQLEDALAPYNSIEQKLRYIQKTLAVGVKKNRFYINVDTAKTTRSVAETALYSILNKTKQSFSKIKRRL